MRGKDIILFSMHFCEAKPGTADLRQTTRFLPNRISEDLQLITLSSSL